jgi:beta-lactamase superfamily II metal-dependent hydrolase
MDFSIDMLSVGDADAIILWLKQDGADFIIFLDGGKPGDGNEVVKHYNAYIKPHMTAKPIMIVINSHPHRDHIGGLPEIINHFGTDIKRVYFNDPLAYVNLMQRNLITEYHQKYSANRQITGLYESLKDVDDFKTLLKKYGLTPQPIFSDTNLGHNLFKVLGPSEAFYKQKIQFFTDKTSLERMHLLKEAEEDVNEVEEGNKPCVVVDEKNDTSAENLTSTIIQLTDSSNRRYLFTADSGVDSYESAQNNGFNMKDFHIAQLPHHGSRRNVNTNWICNFNPKQYWVSAAGNKKHPRKAVIECIKKNLPNCKTYSTHKGGSKHINSTANLFPDRGWGSAEPL